jgi:hypothetical protein
MAVSVGIVILGIAVTSAFGLWTTQSDKIPKRLDSEALSSLDSANSGTASSTSQASGASGVSQGTLEYDPADIKGSYTFLEISNLYLIPLKDLTAAFSVPEADAATFKCKDLESIFSDAENEIGTASVRLFVSYYHGLDYDSDEEVYLTEKAFEILKQGTRATEDQLAYLETHTVAVP